MSEDILHSNSVLYCWLMLFSITAWFRNLYILYLIIYELVKEIHFIFHSHNKEYIQFGKLTSNAIAFDFTPMDDTCSQAFGWSMLLHVVNYVTFNFNVKATKRCKKLICHYPNSESPLTFDYLLHKLELIIGFCGAIAGIINTLITGKWRLNNHGNKLIVGNYFQNHYCNTN